MILRPQYKGYRIFSMVMLEKPMDPSLTLALQALALALDRLEAAGEQMGAMEDVRSDRALELSALQQDRLRLADSLDHATAQSKALQKTHDELADRVERATRNIVTILEKSPL
jgi:predicted  nucleic acid-binding Zn-ribbon protein